MKFATWLRKLLSGSDTEPDAGMISADPWQEKYERLRDPKVSSGVPHDAAIQREIIGSLESAGLKVTELTVDVGEYQTYVEAAQYSRRTYYNSATSPNFPEKALEHYLSTILLDLNSDDVYLDIASQMSPTPEIFKRMYGCEVYRQDIDFPAGFNGDTIGSDAGEMPVPDDFASKMALHCSLEHFEGDADTRFIREAQRVLKPGGLLCILPLYLHNEYAIQTDPDNVPPEGIPFDSDATLYCARGWGNRHGRFYDVEHLKSRLADHVDTLSVEIFVVINEKAVDPNCYLKFAALFRKSL